MDKEGYQEMNNMAGMVLVSSKNALGVMTGGGGEQGRGRRSERHVSSATTTMARREAPSILVDFRYEDIYFKKYNTQ